MAETLTRRELLKRGALGAVAAAAIATPALAQDPVALKPEEEPVWKQAATWARGNDGIAVHVQLGTDSGHSPQVIENFFEQGFRDQYGVTAEAFVEVTDTPGTVVSYYYRESALKPVPFDVATSQESLNSVVAKFKSSDTAQLEAGAPPSPQG